MEYVVYAAIAILAILGTLYIVKYKNKREFKRAVDFVDNQINQIQQAQDTLKQEKEELQQALDNLRDQYEKNSTTTLDDFEAKYRNTK